ncbi:MAG: hypothetical protein ACD_3C00054G0023 [uncultured bacterium (gcode 4)]|uniref:Uncharacterized protein n=1 Tax=uncultured bacterium (gcode 4) TaxID=1234023 RepID=K2FZU9_9BACT|nr:MAG: hypothetical protein ACD_3C00054G0023 [uncultured bacterium (gcode 4)]
MTKPKAKHNESLIDISPPPIKSNHKPISNQGSVYFLLAFLALRLSLNFTSIFRKFSL